MIEDHRDAASPADPNLFFQDAEVLHSRGGKVLQKNSYLSVVVYVILAMFAGRTPGQLSILPVPQPQQGAAPGRQEKGLV